VNVAKRNADRPSRAAAKQAITHPPQIEAIGMEIEWYRA
jgi:hypothetical protein